MEIEILETKRPKKNRTLLQKIEDNIENLSDEKAKKYSKKLTVSKIRKVKFEDIWDWNTTQGIENFKNILRTADPSKFNFTERYRSPLDFDKRRLLKCIDPVQSELLGARPTLNDSIFEVLLRIEPWAKNSKKFAHIQIIKDGPINVAMTDDHHVISDTLSFVRGY